MSENSDSDIHLGGDDGKDPPDDWWKKKNPDDEPSESNDNRSIDNSGDELPLSLDNSSTPARDLLEEHEETEEPHEAELNAPDASSEDGQPALTVPGDDDSSSDESLQFTPNPLDEDAQPPLTTIENEPLDDDISDLELGGGEQLSDLDLEFGTEPGQINPLSDEPVSDRSKPEVIEGYLDDELVWHTGEKPAEETTEKRPIKDEVPLDGSSPIGEEATTEPEATRPSTPPPVPEEVMSKASKVDNAKNILIRYIEYYPGIEDFLNLIEEYNEAIKAKDEERVRSIIDKIISIFRDPNNDKYIPVDCNFTNEFKAIDLIIENMLKKVMPKDNELNSTKKEKAISAALKTARIAIDRLFRFKKTKPMSGILKSDTREKLENLLDYIRNSRLPAIKSRIVGSITTWTAITIFTLLGLNSKSDKPSSVPTGTDETKAPIDLSATKDMPVITNEDTMNVIKQKHPISTPPVITEDPTIETKEETQKPANPNQWGDEDTINLQL